MADLYEKEGDRNKALHEVFDHHKLHFASTNVDRTKYWTDGEIQIHGHRYVIIEFKNEIATASAEPYFQAIQYYVEHTRERATKYRSPLPCFLVCITGECSQTYCCSNTNCSFIQGQPYLSPALPGMCGQWRNPCRRLLYFTSTLPIPRTCKPQRVTSPLFTRLSNRWNSIIASLNTIAFPTL